MSNKKYSPRLSVDRDKSNTKNIDLVKYKSDSCSFCGVPTKEHGHYHATEDNIFYTCSMCYYLEHLDKLKKINKGTIILLPEIPQVVLFSILRQCWFLDYNKEKYQDTKHEEVIDLSNNIQDLFLERKDFAITYYAQGIENVDIIINFLHTISDSNYKKRSDGLLGLRWLPSKDIFTEEQKYWNESHYKQFNPNTFKKLVKQVAEMVKKKNNT